ncbi:MAG: aminotransferase class V-fold PLP-dependent enzyme [Chloroflexota bacterium]
MEISSLFMLDPSVVFLNHGSFGAVPAVVFENYQYWQRRLELQPVLFLGREFDELLQRSRAALAEYINSSVNDVVYIPNATFGVNMIARAIKFNPGDEILSTDHEYGACDLAWQHVIKNTGAIYKKVKLLFPILSEEELINSIFDGVTEKTKVIYISHITSPTAIILPIEKICKRARELGILSIIDGAHGPGQVDLDMLKINADVYIGNCHKWLMAPKGAGFIYCNQAAQEIIEPLVVSWGSADTDKGGSKFINRLQWTGTNDPAAYLTVASAIQFIKDNQWNNVRADCRKLLSTAISEIASITGLQSYYDHLSKYYCQMASVRIPDNIDLVQIKNKLYEDFRIEVPFIQLGDKKFIRISVQGYNTEKDIDILLAALKGIIKN